MDAGGGGGAWRQQTVLGRGRWDADALRDVVRNYALETLADPDAVLVIDETRFLKRGQGVLRRGAAVHGLGRQDRLQIGIFAAYVSKRGHAFIDRALYLPKARADDPPRLAAAHLPVGTGFSTKPQLARAMIERAIAARTPFAWVAADSVYGVGEIETALRKVAKGYVLGVTGKRHFRSWGKAPIAGAAEDIAAGLEASDWKRLSAGEGIKGARLHDWPYVELADLDAEDLYEGASGAWTRGFLIRRHIADGDLAFFTTWCPAGATLDILVQVEAHRWAIEDSFETAKNKLGFNHDETRSWHGWRRLVSLVILAFAMMAVIRYKSNAAPPQKRRGYRFASAVPDPLVRPGDPAHRHPPRPATAGPNTSWPGPSGDALTKPQRPRLTRSEAQLEC